MLLLAISQAVLSWAVDLYLRNKMFESLLRWVDQFELILDVANLWFWGQLICEVIVYVTGFICRRGVKQSKKVHLIL
jgi:hypothetical protein